MIAAKVLSLAEKELCVAMIVVEIVMIIIAFVLVVEIDMIPKNHGGLMKQKNMYVVSVFMKDVLDAKNVETLTGKTVIKPIAKGNGFV